ncbi:MAG: hypothetical protein ACR2P5_04705 [Gammaproteobacteria bacterium]
MMRIEFKTTGLPNTARVAQVVRDVAERIEQGELSGDIKDMAGDVIGSFALDPS